MTRIIPLNKIASNESEWIRKWEKKEKQNDRTKRRFFVYKKFAAKRYRHAMSKSNNWFNSKRSLAITCTRRECVRRKEKMRSRSQQLQFKSCASVATVFFSFFFLFLQLCANTRDTVTFVLSECCLVIQNTTVSFHLCATTKNHFRLSVAHCRVCIMKPLVWLGRKAFADCRLEWIEHFKPDVVIRIYMRTEKPKLDSGANSCDTKLVIVCLRLMNTNGAMRTSDAFFLYWPFGKGELFVA